MAIQCSGCGSSIAEDARVCAACGWDLVDKKFAAKPAGLDLLFHPGVSQQNRTPEPPPAPVLDASPVDLAPPPPPPEPPKPEPPPPTGFPSDLLNPVLKALRRTEAGREALSDPRAKAAVAALRRPGVFVAVAAGFGLWGVAMLVMILPGGNKGAKPIILPNPEFGYVRRSASFAAAPQVVVNTPSPALMYSVAASTAAAAAPAPPSVVAPAPAAAAPAPSEPPGPSWTFQGAAFDLLTTRAVFAADLIFVDAHGKVVGRTTTDTKGRYQITIPSGAGYKLKVERADYTGRYIDDSDPDRSLRAASAEEKRILMKAAGHNLSWIGNSDGAVTRNLALVPIATESQ